MRPAVQSIQRFRDRLLTDPNFVVQYIYGNNPDQVVLNLRAIGLQISNVDDVMNAVHQLLKDGKRDVVIQAFRVPFLTDRIDPAEIPAVKEVAAAFRSFRKHHRNG